MQQLNKAGIDRIFDFSLFSTVKEPRFNVIICVHTPPHQRMNMINANIIDLLQLAQQNIHVDIYKFFFPHK